MPNFKDDKSKFTMKNMNYYKGKHAASEAGSPYNKNGSTASKTGKLMSESAKYLAEFITEKAIGNMNKTFTEGFIPNKDLKLRKDLTEGFIPHDADKHEVLHKRLINKKEYTPQTKSRKDISTDVTPQSQKGKKFLKSKVTKLITNKDLKKKAEEVSNWAKSLKKGKK